MLLSLLGGKMLIINWKLALDNIYNVSFKGIVFREIEIKKIFFFFYKIPLGLAVSLFFFEFWKYVFLQNLGETKQSDSMLSRYRKSWLKVNQEKLHVGWCHFETRERLTYQEWCRAWSSYQPACLNEHTVGGGSPPDGPPKGVVYSLVPFYSTSWLRKSLLWDALGYFQVRVTEGKQDMISQETCSAFKSPHFIIHSVRLVRKP